MQVLQEGRQDVPDPARQMPEAKMSDPVHARKPLKPHQLKILDDVLIPDLIIRFKPYIYGTKKDIHMPGCEVSMRADLWFTSSTAKTLKAKNGYLTRVEMDFATGFIRKDGKIVDAVNAAEILAKAEDALAAYLRS